MSILLKTIYTALTIAAGITVTFSASFALDGGWWVSFCVGFIGTGLTIRLAESFWEVRSDGRSR